MVLNNKPQMFAIWFPEDYFFPKITEKYGTMLNRMKLPYYTVEDFMNSQIQTVTLPSFSSEPAVNQRWQNELGYDDGKEILPDIEKNLTISFKLTESYLSWFILFDQIELYKEYGKNHTRMYWQPIYITFLSDFGFELVTMEFLDIVPTSLTPLNLSYKSSLSMFSTVDLGLRFNYLNTIMK